MRVIDLVLFIVLFASAIIAVISFKSLPAKERLIAILLILTFPQTISCFVLFKQKQNNLYLIHWYSLIEFILIMAYYHLLLTKRLFINIYVTLTAIGLLWFTIPFFFQKPLLHSLSFLFFESLAIIIVGLLYCLDLFLKEKAYIMQMPSFWITIALLIYWTTTYTRNGLIIFHNSFSINILTKFDNLFILISVAFYASLAGILLTYKKFRKAYE